MRRSRAVSVAVTMVTGIFFDCTFPPILHVGELPELMPIMARDRTNWPRCLRLCTAGERDPWAASLGQLAERSLELALGAYPVDDRVW